MKAKKVGKKNANTRQHADVLSKRKSKNLAKNLSVTLQVEIDPLVNKLEYTNNKRPFNPSLPNVLEPSKLLLPTDFSESCLH